MTNQNDVPADAPNDHPNGQTENGNGVHVVQVQTPEKEIEQKRREEEEEERREEEEVAQAMGTAMAMAMELAPGPTVVELAERTPTSNSDSSPNAPAAATTEGGEKKPDGVTHLLHGPRLALVFMGMCLAVFLAALDQTIVSTALPTIAADLNGFSDYSWVATAYLLTMTAFQPLYGRFSDIFGRKPVMLFAIFIFEIGSLLCGVSTNMSMLIASRAVAGIGGGGLMSMVMIIMSDVINMRDRGKYQGMVGAMFGLASVVGPLLGGAFTDHVTWRWCFYINLPFGAITVLVTVLFLNLPKPSGNMRAKLALIDYWGTITLLPCITALLLAVSWGGNTYAWNSGVVISMFLVAGLFLVAFLIAEWKFAKFPILPLHLFRRRNYSIMAMTAFLMGWCMLGSLIYLPLYFQVVKGDNATSSGLRFLPLMISMVFCSIMSGIVIAKTGKYRWIPTFGTCLLCLGMGLLIMLKQDSTFGQLIGLLIPAGMGLGWLIQTILLVTQAAVDPKYLGVATAAVNFFRTVGGVVGVAVCGAVINNTLNSELTGNPAFANSNFNINNLDVQQLHNAPPATQKIVIDAMTDAIDKIFEVATPVAGLAIIVGSCIKFIPLRKFVGQGPPVMAD